MSMKNGFSQRRAGNYRVSPAEWCFWISVIAVALIVATSGCAVNSATGKRHLNLIGESREIAMGQEADSQVVASLGLYPDSSLQRYVQMLGDRLAKNSERPDLPWSFRVVDDPAVNAFALPGGFIFVTRGLLTHVNSEAELVGVIGHEIGHVTAQHSVHSMSNQQLTQIGLAAGMMIKPELQRYGQVVNAGLGLLYLKFSRDDESEADGLGFRYMVRAGSDPREMVQVFDMLNRVSTAGGGGRTPEWLETHPNPENRSRDFQLEIDTLTQDLNRLSVNRNSYLALIDGAVFGQNPREGFFRNSHYYQPELEFDIEFPSGWQTVNQKSVVASVSPNQDAIMQVTLAQGASRDAAAKLFFAQSGLEAGKQETGNVNGLPSIAAFFRVQTDEGVLRGKALFLDCQGNTYQILSYTTEALWGQYQLAMLTSMGSFRRLTDQKILQMQPMRLKIVKLKKSTTLAALAQSENSPTSLSTLAIINQVAEDHTFNATEHVKVVTGDKFEGE